MGRGVKTPKNKGNQFNKVQQLNIGHQSIETHQQKDIRQIMDVECCGIEGIDDRLMMELKTLIEALNFGRLEEIQVKDGRIVSPPKRITKKIKVGSIPEMFAVLRSIKCGLIRKIEITNGKIAIVHIEYDLQPL
ncbi:MAG: hypothetical protein KJ737_12045 [Proteobacteria bacterium]|nr:hypothetical protein [Pseudomonadota bacterium]